MLDDIQDYLDIINKKDIEIPLDIEDKFDIMIDDDVIGEMNTVQDSIDVVLQKTA